MSALVVVVAATGVAAAAAAAVGAVTARRTTPGSPLANAHAHNDYRHSRPLRSALAHGFTSVEVDIWPGPDDELLVGHDEADLRSWRTLRMLYLDPLARRVAAHGSVHRDYDGGFQLVIEIKSDPDRTWRLLDAELRRYASMLTRYEPDGVVPGAVSVVITGKPPRKQLEAATSEGEVRYAAVEGSLSVLGTETPVALVPVCSANFGELFTWRGRGPMPDDQRKVLRETVDSVHADGRRIRFWGYPGPTRGVRRAIWAELRDAGVDHLGTDDLSGLRRFEVKADRTAQK
jgi:hypothetical protein